MKTYLIQSVCGAVLLGTLVTASAQTSNIIAFTYSGATVQSGGTSAYLGFNPTTGTYLLTDIDTDLYVYEASFVGNNSGGPAVSFLPTGGDTSSDPFIYAGTDFNATHIQYLSVGAVIDNTMVLGGNPSLDTLAIDDTGYMGLRFNFGDDSFYYGWAEVQRDADQTYTLLATGYNTEADQPILAGQTVAVVPEPTMLALFAIGGLLMLRRRK